MGFSTSEDGSSNASSSELGLGVLDVEETYTSSLFQTEPLYQFYDRELSVSILRHERSTYPRLIKRETAVECKAKCEVTSACRCDMFSPHCECVADQEGSALKGHKCHRS